MSFVFTSQSSVKLSCIKINNYLHSLAILQGISGGTRSFYT